MRYEKVTLPHSCPRCRSAQEIVHALSLASGSVRASSSFSCKRCGEAFEVDDQGVPEEWRSAFYAANGRWELRILDAGPDKAALLRRLREILGLNVAGIGAVAQKIPGPITEGTRVEMELLKQESEAAGAMADVTPATP